jgi:hypothetical protein
MGLCLTAFLGMLFTARLAAQATEGTILGIVTDSSGGVIANAPVTVLSVEKGTARQTRTNDLGEYVVTNLALGWYTVAIEAPGFIKSHTSALRDYRESQGAH